MLCACTVLLLLLIFQLVWFNCFSNPVVSENKIPEDKICPAEIAQTDRKNLENCAAVRCTSHSECTRGKSCCPNGCVNACVDTPPVIDWLVKPKPAHNSRYFWLADGDSSDHYSDMECTTSAFNEMMLSKLRCPSGYWCYVVDNGDLIQGIPNKGICRPNDDNAKLAEQPRFDGFDRQPAKSKSDEVDSAGYEDDISEEEIAKTGKIHLKVSKDDDVYVYNE